MLVGNPDKLAFLIERVPEWEADDVYKNGLLFLFINGRMYPKQLRTTTLSTELFVLLDENSPLMNPVINNELYELNSNELFQFISQLTYPADYDKDNDYSYLIDFHEINDSGYSVFIISNDQNIKVLIGKWLEDIIVFIDEIEIRMQEYETIKQQLTIFYNHGKL